MTTYRLMDGVSGRPGVGSSGTQPPTSPTAYSGPFQAGTLFSVTGQVMWLQGYYWWVPTGGDTGAQKFCLWARYGTSSQAVVPGSTVTSGTLTANSFNFVALSSPIQLAPGELYVAATGWTSVHGFPDTHNQFATGDPYVGGITNGPLTAWSDSTAGGTHLFPGGSSNWGLSQGVFGTGNTGGAADPTLNFPAGSSNSANFWIDVEVSDTAPGGYAGSYRLYPNMYDAVGYTNDTANNFTLGMEFTLSKTCTLDNIWFYSPSGVTQLPTECAIWSVSGQSIVSGTDNTSPSWTLPGGGAASAGAGWMYAPMSGSVSLPAGDYKVTVFNGAGSPAIWNASTALYWSTGFGASGLTSGPITAPDNASATSPGQETYHQGTPITYPLSNTGPYNYWVDVEVTPASGTPHTSTAALTVTPVFSAGRTRGKYRTGALTVTPSFSAVRARGTYRTAALTVTPSFTAGRQRGKYRTGSLTVVPSFDAARTRGHYRTGALEVIPVFAAVRIRGRYRSAALTVTPSFSAIPSGGAFAPPVFIYPAYWTAAWVQADTRVTVSPAGAQTATVTSAVLGESAATLYPPGPAVIYPSP